MNISRETKLKTLGLENNSRDISDVALDLFYEKYMKDTILLKELITGDNNINETLQNKAKIFILLKIINKILKNLNMNGINDLIEFKKINRDDILNEQNKKIANEMENEIFGPFNKTKCGYYRRDNKQYILNLLKGMIKEVGYALIKRNKDRKNKDGTRQWIVTYSITNK